MIWDATVVIMTSLIVCSALSQCSLIVHQTCKNKIQSNWIKMLNSVLKKCIPICSTILFVILFGAHWVNTTYYDLNFCQVIYDIIWYWLHTLRWLHLLRSNKASRPAGSHLLDPQHGMVITGGASSNNNTMHDEVIKWNHFPRYWPFVRGIHRSRWIPRTKASDAELWCFLWSVPE